MLGERKYSWNYLVSRMITFMLLAMLIYLALMFWSGWDSFKEALSAFPLITYGYKIIGLVILGWLLRGLRWHFYVLYLRLPVPYWGSILAFLASFAFTATPGKAGEAVKAGLLQERYGIPMVDTMGILLIERVEDLLAVLILASGGLILITQAGKFFLISMILVGGITIFASKGWLYRWTFAFLGRFSPFKSISEKLLQIFDTGSSLFRMGPFLAGLTIAVLAWSCEGLAFYFILEGFGVTFPIWIAFSVYSLATVMGALSLMPGGLGGFEAVMLLLLKAMEVNVGQGIPSTVMTRLCTLWLVSILGFFFMGIWKLGYTPGSANIKNGH